MTETKKHVKQSIEPTEVSEKGSYNLAPVPDYQANKTGGAFMHTQDKRVSPLLVTLVVTFVSFLIMSNILANHMLQFFNWSIDAGTLTFPITYILSDVFSEVYGYEWSRRVSWIAAFMTLIFSLLILLSCALPQPEWYDGTHFEIALRSSFRIVFASIIAFVSGDFVNDRVFRKMKRRNTTGFKLRAIVSSVYGNTADTSAFVVLAFAGAMPVNEMFPMILVNILFKTGYELCILPITQLVVNRVKAAEGRQECA